MYRSFELCACSGGTAQVWETDTTLKRAVNSRTTYTSGDHSVSDTGPAGATACWLWCDAALSLSSNAVSAAPL